MLKAALERAASIADGIAVRPARSEFTEKIVQDLADRARCRDLELDFLRRIWRRASKAKCRPNVYRTPTPRSEGGYDTSLLTSFVG